MSNDPVDPDDVWTQIAKQAAALAQRAPAAPTCDLCRQLISLHEGYIRPHFASVTDVRPCPRSYQLLHPKR